MWCFRSTNSSTRTATRASVPIIGTILVVALTVIVATVVGTAMISIGSTSGTTVATTEPAPATSIDLSVEGETLQFTHEHGEPLDVRQLSIRISVDDDPLAEQPPLPFFSTSGFEPGPTGPFNTASDPEWEVGETATLTVADTNTPELESGSTVSVRLTTADRVVTEIETTV